MVYVDEIAGTFEFANDLHTIVCNSLGQLIETTNKIAGINLLTILN